MSFRRNVYATYLSQAYVTGIGLVMVPFYLKYLGADAFGLVGFFTLIQAWFHLLDMGLSSTLLREVARFKAEVVSGSHLRFLVRVLEFVCIAVTLFAVLAAFGLAETVATSWLEAGALPLEQVQQAIILMGIALPLRWTSGLYRAAVNGFERQGLLASYNALIATARFVGVVGVLHYVDSTPRAFFLYQLIVAGVEVVGLCVFVHRIMPPAQLNPTPIPMRAIVEPLRFAAGAALTGAFFVVVTQADKLLLSTVLPLAEFGYVTLAVSVAGGVSVVSLPFAQNLIPRLAKLHAQGDDIGLLALYRQSTRFIAAAVGTIGGLLAFCAEPLLYAWTGDAVAAQKASAPLRWYALGNAIYALAIFPYYLQCARGSLRLHIVGSAGLVLILLPMAAFFAEILGAVGGSLAWFLSILVYFLIWVSYSHKQLLGGSWRWLVKDVGLHLVLPVGVALVISTIAVKAEATRWESLLALLVVASGQLLVILAFSALGRFSRSLPE